MLCRRCIGTGIVTWGLSDLTCAFCGGSGRLNGPRPEEEPPAPEAEGGWEFEELYRVIGGEG